jgi:hypothetical protein
MPSTAYALETLKRLPLAEAVLLLWQWQCAPAFLADLFEEHRGACYTKELSFSTLVGLIGDALLEYDGSGRKSFQRGRADGELAVSDQATYRKLGRLPTAVSEQFLACSTAGLLELLPGGRRCESPVPASLSAFAVCVLDGKAVKRVPKRMRPLQGTSGGVLGGKAVVALHLQSGLAVAMATDPDGDTNEAKLVPDLLPQVTARWRGVLYVCDGQFGNPAQAAAFTARAGDHFLFRHDGKTKFTPDPGPPVRRGTDSQGRSYEEDYGTFGGEQNKHRRHVRRLTLYRPGEATVVLVTDLLDGEAYPAEDLLALYLARWTIERVFQQITEVFDLKRLIGTTPQGTLFQLAFCLLLYNQIQVVRRYVAAGAKQPVESVSPELLFEDVRRQLIALHEVLKAGEVAALLPPVGLADELRQRLRALLGPLGTERWRKSKPKKRKPPPTGDRKREHQSAHKVIQQYRRANQQPARAP